MSVNCVKCNKPCTEERCRQRRDGSVVIIAIHDDGSPSHTFSEWPTITAFFSRAYSADARRRIR